jgi:hypothetical protein
MCVYVCVCVFAYVRLRICMHACYPANQAVSSLLDELLEMLRRLPLSASRSVILGFRRDRFFPAATVFCYVYLLFYIFFRIIIIIIIVIFRRVRQFSNRGVRYA